MKINQIINPDLMRRMVEGGYIRTQRHPSLPLTLYNYSEKAQFSRVWNTATLASRGLIVHDGGEIVARPFPKFFNWGETPPKGRRFKMDLEEPVVVTDKVDGSLGILYDRGDRFGYVFATRGSFTSDQARHANMIWLEKYKKYEYLIRPDVTMLFEIIYPENRIVVNYGAMNDVILLGGVHKDTGRILGPEMFPGWPGPRVAVMPYRTLAEAVEAKPRPGKEGLVVRSLGDGLMLKIKQDDYVSLHRVVTGLNEKEIWRRAMKANLMDKPDYVNEEDLILENIPDELHEWVISVATQLMAEVYSMLGIARDVYRDAVTTEVVPDTYDRANRKLFASRITKIRAAWLTKALWLMYDGHDPREFLWKQVEPRGDVKNERRD